VTTAHLSGGESESVAKDRSAARGSPAWSATSPALLSGRGGL